MSHWPYVKFAIALLIIINPISKLFIFNQLAEDLSSQERKQRAIESGVAMIAFMIMAFWFGMTLLHDVIGIKIGDFEIAGGLLIFYSGFTLMYEGRVRVDKSAPNFSVVPLSFPIVVGPGTLSVIIIHSNQFQYLYQKWIANILFILVGLIVFMLMYFSDHIVKRLNPNVIAIVNKLMAVILMAIAVEMVRTGIMHPVIHTS